MLNLSELSGAMRVIWNRNETCCVDVNSKNELDESGAPFRKRSSVRPSQRLNDGANFVPCGKAPAGCKNSLAASVHSMPREVTGDVRFTSSLSLGHPEFLLSFPQSAPTIANPLWRGPIWPARARQWRGCRRLWRIEAEVLMPDHSPLLPHRGPQ